MRYYSLPTYRYVCMCVYCYSSNRKYKTYGVRMQNESGCAASFEFMNSKKALQVYQRAKNAVMLQVLLLGD